MENLHLFTKDMASLESKRQHEGMRKFWDREIQLLPLNRLTNQEDRSIMRSMNSLRLTLLIPFLFCFSWGLASSVPYTGKISIRGVNYHGDAQFRFSLHDGNGTTHWENGKSGETIKVSVHNGRYEVFLGGQGMNSLTPELFLKNDPLYLKVEFDLGDGLQHLGPDQLITSTPRALVAEVAKMAESMPSGSISRDMLNAEVLSQLEGKELSDSSAPSVITRDMLSEDIRLDLNKTITITRDMLPLDVLQELNRTISKSMLGSDVLNDLNATIGMNRLSTGSYKN